MKTISLKCKCPPRTGSWRKKHKFNVLHAKNWSSWMLGRNKCKRDLIMPQFLWGFFHFGFAISVLVIKSMIWVSSQIPVFPQSPLSLGQYFADPKNFQNTNGLLALTPKLPLEIAVHCLSKWVNYWVAYIWTVKLPWPGGGGLLFTAISHLVDSSASWALCLRRAGPPFVTCPKLQCKGWSSLDRGNHLHV